MPPAHRRHRENTSPPTGFKVIDLTGGDYTLPEGEYFRAISFGVDGALQLQTLDNNGNDAESIIPEGYLATGVQHGMIIKRIVAAGTTAENILGHY